MYIVKTTRTGASQSEPVPHRRVKTPHYYVDCARWICSSWLIVSRFVYQSTTFMTIECEILFWLRKGAHVYLWCIMRCLPNTHYDGFSFFFVLTIIIIIINILQNGWKYNNMAKFLVLVSSAFERFANRKSWTKLYRHNGLHWWYHKLIHSLPYWSIYRYSHLINK